MKRMLILSHDVIGTRMAGPGIRYWELARVLSDACAVTLAAPAPIDLAPQGFTTAHYTPGASHSLAALTAEADIILANGVALASNPELAAIAAPLLIDLYDPTLLENLELFRSAPPTERAERTAADHDLLQRQLAAGDAFICATERQRDLYIGALMAAGRITPELADADPLLRSLIDVVSFGLPSDPPPAPTGPVLRNVLPGIDASSDLLLWTGGLWDWMDPHTLIHAMPLVLAERPTAHLVFLAGLHPGPALPMRAPETARALAAELGLLDTAVHFYDEWVPYARRGDFLQEADLLVSLHRPGLESTYAAIRSRFLDHLWAGRSSVVSAGDAAADLVQRHNLGRCVPADDPKAVAAAIVELLDDPAERIACARNARTLAQDYTWARVAEPIRTFCRRKPTFRIQNSEFRIQIAGGTGLNSQPHPTLPDAAGGTGFSPQPPSHPISRVVQGAANHTPEQTPMTNETLPHLQAMERQWALNTPPTGLLERLARPLVSRILGSLFAQQREFNGATIRALYGIVERQERTDTQINAVMAQLVSLRDDLALLSGRADTLAGFDGQINDRVERLAYAVRLIDEALAAADETSAAIAAQVAAIGAGEAQHD
jgi:glycosyltransferase involved in cell wall biosynthesis